MQFREFRIAGPVEIQPHKIADERGYFAEIFRADSFSARCTTPHFVQENESLNLQAGTLRGIHFQAPPTAQAKLVRCLRGTLFDVAVDLRRGSPTYGQAVSVILTAEQNNQLWIPIGFGHGFCTLEPDTVVSYRVTDFYSPQDERGFAWNDPDIGIEWPSIADPQTLSPRDRALPKLSALPPSFRWQGA